MEHNVVKNPSWQEANQLAVSSMAENWNSGLPRTNPASGGVGSGGRGGEDLNFGPSH